MKRKQNDKFAKWIPFIIIAIIIVIVAMVFIVNNLGDKSELPNNETNKIQVGTDIKLKENVLQTKEYNRYSFNELKMVKAEENTVELTLNITNNTEENIEEQYANIIFINENGENIGEIILLLPELLPGASCPLQAFVSDDLVNAVDYRFEKAELQSEE